MNYRDKEALIDYIVNEYELSNKEGTNAVNLYIKANPGAQVLDIPELAEEIFSDNSYWGPEAQ